MNGATTDTLMRRAVYGGRKGRRALRRLRAEGVRLITVLVEGRIMPCFVYAEAIFGDEYWIAPDDAPVMP